MRSGFVWCGPGQASRKKSWKCAKKRSGAYRWEVDTWDPFFADNCWIIGMPVAELQTMAREWYELLKQAGLHIDWGRGGVVHDGARHFAWQHRSAGYNNHAEYT